MTVKRPNGFLYFIVYAVFYPFLKIFFRLKVDRKNYDPPEGPFLVLSNHSSFMDFLLVMLAVYPRRLNAVAAQKFFFYRPLNKLLPVMGAIPKNLFDPDVRSIRRIKTVLRSGGRILLYPEGRCSTDGAYAGVHKATGKLIKNLAVPVVSCHIEGGYVCMPFWRKGMRLGTERVTIAGLFSAEETKAMTVDEINAAIDARLSGLDTPPPEKPFHTFRARRLAEGLHNILYYCPRCRSEFTLETEGNTIRCAACGNEAEMDRFSALKPLGDSDAPKSVHAWFREQTEHEMAALSSDMEPIRERVTVRVPAASEGAGMVVCGSGMLYLMPDGWRFEGELNGEYKELFFPIDTVPAMPFDPVDNFQIYANGSFFMFTPEDPIKSVKYSILGECAYRLFASRMQMTPGYDSGFTIQARF